MIRSRLIYRKSYSPRVTLLIGFILGLVGLAMPQHLTPPWAASGWASLENLPQYSASGTRVLVIGGGGFSVYDATSGDLLSHVVIDGNNGGLESACLSASGAAVFYSTTQGPSTSPTIFDYNVSANTQTALPITESNPPRMLTASKDGHTLAYLITDNSTQRDEVCLFNLTSNSAISRFDYVNMASTTTQSLGFVGNDTQVVLSGPTIYGFSGNLVSELTSSYTAVVVSPDETKVFSYDLKDSLYHGYSVPDLTSLWGENPPTVNGAICNPHYNLPTPSADSQTLLFGGYDSQYWYVASVNAATGIPLSGYLQTQPIDSAGSPSIVARPLTNQLLLGPAGTTDATVFSYSSSTGQGAFIKTLFEGVVGDASYGCPNFQPILWPASTGQISSLAVLSLKDFGVSDILVRNADSGTILGSIADSDAIASPDGQYYLSRNNSTINVFSTSPLKKVASYTISSNYGIYADAWGGSSHIVVSDPFYATVLAFNGSSLTLSHTFKLWDDYGYRLSPDGTRIAILNSDGSISVFTSNQGALLYQIAADPRSTIGINDISFAGNLLGVHEASTVAAYSYLNEFRVFNTSTSPPTLVSKITVPLTGAFNELSASGVLSPDGLNVVMGNNASSTATDPRETGTVRLYLAATGKLVSEWDNQFIPDFGTNGNGIGNPTFHPSFCFSPDSSTLIWSSGGALISAPTPSAHLTVSLDRSHLGGGSTANVTVTLAPMPTVATVVDMSCSSTAVSIPSSVEILAGTQTVTFPVETDGVSILTNAIITGKVGATTGTATLTIAPPTAMALSIVPTAVVGGRTCQGTLSLNSHAGGSGLIVNLQAADPSFFKLPTAIRVGANASSVTFNIPTANPPQTTKVTVTATAGTLTATDAVTVLVGLSASMAPSSQIGGTSVILTLTLTSPAPAGGTTVSLAANNSALVPPGTVTIPAGAMTKQFSIPTNPVALKTAVTLTASGGTVPTAVAGVIIDPPTVLSVTPASTTIKGGLSGTAKIVLTGPAPANFSIACSSSNAVLKMPASCPFAKGATSATVTFTTSVVTAATTVTVGAGAKSCTVTVTP